MWLLTKKRVGNYSPIKEKPLGCATYTVRGFSAFIAMDSKTLLNLWTKLCMRKKNTPICLITVSDDGFPHVFTNHNKETLAKVYKHLLEIGVVGEETHFDDREN